MRAALINMGIVLRCEQHGRDRSRENRHTCHVGDATEDMPRPASGQLPILSETRDG